jgi:D-amino-acid dehydrogenase
VRVAVIGAGVAGITSAYELAADGHEVTVFERHLAIAEEASFAHAGLISAGLVSPAAAPGMRHWLLKGLLPGGRGAGTALHWEPAADAGLYRWLWRWWRASRAPQTEDLRAMIGLARLSRQRLDQLTGALALRHEQSSGVLVLLRSDRQLVAAEPQARLMRELGLRCESASVARCLEIEPGLNPEARFSGGLHLPDDGVGNCREFVQQLRDAAIATRRVEFALETAVTGLRRQGHGVALRTEAALAPETAREHQTLGAAPAGRRHDGFAHTVPMLPRPAAHHFDAVVLCTGAAPPALAQQAGLRLPLRAVWGHAATFTLREDGEALRSAVVDVGSGVTLTRLGRRLRVTGGFRLGAGAASAGTRRDEIALAPLYDTVDRWLPFAVERQGAQHWQGARPMLPEGPPVIGPAPMPGVWLNLGHGAHGWTLACGSARLLADRIGGKTPCLDPAPFDGRRWAAGG